MSNADATTSPAVPSPERVLRKLFLTLFLRGRAARHSARAKQKLATMSVARKLWLSLAGYAFLGLMALTFIGQSLVAMALYLHALTFVLVGMYVVTSAGEVLFNKEEADILLHRPVAPRDLLRARIAMLVYVSLWMAGAFNLVGLFAGMGAPDGDWRFPLVHAASISLEALFTTATVVVVYQLCLRWFGRERLDALMTTTQVVLAIVVVVGAQIVPQLMIRMEGQAITRVDHWWAVLVPPAWFAGIDDALAGSGSARAWLLAAIALVATAALVWVALVRLAADYGAGMQTVAESSGQTAARRQQRWLHRLVHRAPLRWWLRDSVSRASFLLAAAYLARDRDVKLRVWPGLAPLMVLPLIMLLPDTGEGPRAAGGMGVLFGATYLSLIPIMALDMLTMSQHWQAADLFRIAPVPGPAALSRGARRAVLALVALPALLVFAVLALVIGRNVADLVLLIPGLLALPVLAMVPCLGGGAVPLSQPPEVAKGAHRALYMIGALIGAGILGGITLLARRLGWLGPALIVEAVVAVGAYVVMRASVERARWHGAE